jgi:hypothetical protein
MRTDTKHTQQGTCKNENRAGMQVFAKYEYNVTKNTGNDVRKEKDRSW